MKTIFTLSQIDRRRLIQKEKQIKEELEKVAKTRATTRGSHSHLPVIAIVGYTNAGMSCAVAAASYSSVVDLCKVCSKVRVVVLV